MDEQLIRCRARKGTIYYANLSGEIISKICSKCETKIKLKDFRRKNGGLGGTTSICKNCESIIGKKYRDENSEKIREIAKRYYQEKGDEMKKKQKVYREENPNVARERCKRWRKKHVELLRERSRIWRKENPEKSRIQVHQRLARKKFLPNDLTAEEMKEIIRFFGGCALTEDNDIHFDHVIPLITGHGGTTYGNMIPLRSDLNLSKNGSNIFEWFESNRQRFELSYEKFKFLIEWLSAINGITSEDYRDHVYWCHENPHSLEDFIINDESEV